MAILTPPDGQQLRYTARMDLPCINNSVEYETLMLALHKAASAGARRIILNSDFLVMVGHVEKEFEPREPQLHKYLYLVRAMERRFEGFTLVHISRPENATADVFAKAATQGEDLPLEFFYQVHREPAISELEDDDEREVLAILAGDWHDPVVDFLLGNAPADPTNLQRMRFK